MLYTHFTLNNDYSSTAEFDVIASKGVMNMAEISEVVMIVSFGASWPMNVIKSYKARTTKGKS